MLKSRILLRHAVQSAPSTSSPEYMPSKQFMYSKVKRPSQKSHFVKVASEIELYKDVYGDDALKRLKINDDTWKVLMEMSWED
uniref:Uncharacterized protein n=1 Tax=Caenorhabditis japonica TaxID=281687 RepID=A0A8R1EI63_CAEJA